MTAARPIHAILTACLLLTATAHARAQVTVVTAGRLLDPETGSEKSNQIILIEEGKIKAIGADLQIPGDANRIDLSQETLLPGLFDARTHLLATVDAKWDLGDFWIMALQRRAGWRAIEGVRHARECWKAASLPSAMSETRGII